MMPKFSSPQKRAVRQLLSMLPNRRDVSDKAVAFLLGYVAFEAQARKIWHYYRCRKRAISESRAGIPLDVLSNATEYFEMNVERAQLELLLASSMDKRGQKSARNLRNGMVHQWRKEDCQEAARRYEEFERAFCHVEAALTRTT